MHRDIVNHSPDSPALAGRGRIVLTIRVRGRLSESELGETPPHPDLLPARGEKEKMTDHALNDARNSAG
jgi:hypothetical protein